MYTVINSMNNAKLPSTEFPLLNASVHPDDELFQLTWNEILYDGGLATWVPRLSFRWLTICVCVIGIIGNILAVYTLLRRRMRTLSTYTYLTALCVSNTVTQISVIIFEADVLIVPNRLNCFAVSIAKALASSTFALSTWITVCFTIERYIMICLPFTGEHKCTRRNAIYVIIMCLSFSLTYLIPQLLAQKCHPIIQYPYEQINSTENLSSRNQSESTLTIYWVSGLSEIGKSLAYRLTVTLFFNCFLIRIIPFLVIFQLNFLLIQTLSHTKRRLRQMNPHEEKRHDVTYMLVIVISAYLVCVIPSIPFAAFFAYDPHQYVGISFHYRTFQYIDEFAKFLTIFNSALQCYLYIFFGKRFRRELSSFLCCLCVKYFYMPIPQSYSSSDREHFSPDAWAFNDVFEIVLQGEWSTDKYQDLITGIEFTFHCARRATCVTLSTEPLLRSDSEDDNTQINIDLLKRFKNRVERYFSTVE